MRDEQGREQDWMLLRATELAQQVTEEQATEIAEIMEACGTASVIVHINLMFKKEFLNESEKDNLARLIFLMVIGEHLL